VWIYLETSRLEVKQLKYSAFDRELLAAFLSVRHIRYLLDGRRFHILTDHKPLTQALYRVSDPWTARVQWQLAFLAELTSDVRHNPGKVNVIVDALSRPPPSVVADEKKKSPSGLQLPPGGEASLNQLPLLLHRRRRLHRWHPLPAPRWRLPAAASPLITFTTGGGCTGGLGYQCRAGISLIQRRLRRNGGGPVDL
jgi:hypothetical protein